MESARNSEVRKSGRRSVKIKNLQEVVNAICSEDESYEGSKDIVCPKTPSRKNLNKDAITPKTSTSYQVLYQTPRRSCRKSIKPSQDYDEIVNKSLRSVRKVQLSEEEDENRDAALQPKWTPAKVGRVSQKRGRKSKKIIKGKQNGKEPKQLSEATYNDDVENEIVIIESEDSQKHNEEQDQNPCEGMQAENEIDIESEHINESTHAIQYDSEDYEKTSAKSEQEICIIYESNISNSEIKEEIPSHSNKNSKSLEKVDDSFGCYLKSKDINISDLGLNPLKEEDEEKDFMDNQNIQSSQDVDEMPSLIVCDDDEDSKYSDEKSDERSEQCKKMNETFDAFDSVTIESGLKPNDEVMETLVLSDDEIDAETPTKRVRIVLTDTEKNNYTILNTPMALAKKLKLPSTAKTLTTPKLTTPKQKNKSYRFPTPFKSNKNFKFNDEFKENVRKTPSKHISNLTMNSITTLGPKEIVLRGIRKRSLSVCIDGYDKNHQLFSAFSLKKEKPERIVSFYSPANETRFTDDLDILIENSILQKKRQEKDFANKFVTTRRKRSLSLDESTLHCASSFSKLPRPVVGQNTKKIQTSSTSKAVLRTKLPNFAAIHQKQFNKMENLMDHVSRKQERSKNLINSTTKYKPDSAQKNAALMKNNTPTVKPKAIKKIDLATLSHMNKSPFKATITSSDGSEAKTICNLPNPRIAVVKPIKSGPITKKKPQQQKQLNKYLKSSQVTNNEKPQSNSKTLASSKPAFNLSTSLMAKPTVLNYAQNANTTQMNSTDKTASRLQRHMDLFKGRVPSTRAGAASRRNEVILKGVRSNRRFELQMQHRKNLEQ